MVLADGQVIHPEVLKGIVEQTAEIQLLPITRPFECYDEEDSLRGYKSTCESRNLAKELALKLTNSKYILFLDSDVVMGDPSTVVRMIQLLDRDQTVGACAVHTKQQFLLDQVVDNESRHICMACLMIRKEILSSIIFRNIDSNTCNCLYLTRDINDKGYRTKYITATVAYELDHDRHFFNTVESAVK